MRRRIISIVGIVVAGLTLMAEPGIRGANPQPIRIGALPTMFPGGNREMGPIIKGPIESEIAIRTGLDCDVELVLSLNAMRRKLADGRLQFGLCHGYELAWMRQHEPLIQPLMLVSPDHRPLKAYLVVASTNPAREICDLKGATLAMPKGANTATRLFANRECRCSGQPMSQYFAEITRPANAETALHEVVDNKVQAALVDGTGLRCLDERYPARAKLIRVLAESDEFPLSAVVYHAGVVDSVIVRHFQEAMTKARSNPATRHLMSLMHATGFEPVPPDYAQQLVDCARDYPREGVLKKIAAPLLVRPN